jgi:hypothetical protein
MTLEPREQPIETIQGLLAPKESFPYFANADRFPFEPQAVDYSPVNAWWLADSSFLVYGDPDFIEARLKRSPLPEQGYCLDWLGTRDENRGMVLRNHETLIVAFRGTRLKVHVLLDVLPMVAIDQSDLLIDSKLGHTVFNAGGKVHSGFLEAFKQVIDQLDTIIAMRGAEQRVWLTGHSLGGALATLAAAEIGGGCVQGLYTYGCPRVGDASFAGVLPQRSYYRFVHRDDWFATQPPEFLGYVHAGTLRTVTAIPRSPFHEELLHGAKGLVSALAAMAQERRLDIGVIPFNVPGMADHAPVYYATLLWNELVTDAK